MFRGPWVSPRRETAVLCQCCHPLSKTVLLAVYKTTGTFRLGRIFKSSHELSTAQPPLNHVPKCHMYISFNTFRGGDSTTTLGSLFSMLHHLSSEEMFPNIQSKTPLVQLYSSLIACYVGKETDLHLAANYKFLLFVAQISVGAGSKTEQSPNNSSRVSIWKTANSAHEQECSDLTSKCALFWAGEMICRGPFQPKTFSPRTESTLQYISQGRGFAGLL